MKMQTNNGKQILWVYYVSVTEIPIVKKKS